MDDTQNHALYQAAIELEGATQKADTAALRAKNLAVNVYDRERANLLLAALAEVRYEANQALGQAAKLFDQLSVTVASDTSLPYPAVKVSAGRPDVIAALEDAGIEYTTE